MRISEKTLENQVRRALSLTGWGTWKSHGNKFQKGWPDLFACHSEHGARWIEMKTPRGKLTRDQRIMFPRWAEHGVGIWILTGVHDIALLWCLPNWEEWL